MNLANRTLALAAIVALFAASVGAEEVLVTRPWGKIVKVDFTTGNTHTVVRDRGPFFRALAVRAATGSNALRLTATNATRGGDIRVYDPATGAGTVITCFRRAGSRRPIGRVLLWRDPLRDHDSCDPTLEIRTFT